MRYFNYLVLTIILLVSQPNSAFAGLDDCLKAALNTANPDDLKKSAAFAYNHPSCLQNLVPPTLVPYVALSGSLDAANQSGALNQVGLGFNSYGQCKDKLDLGKATVKQLAPVLKPVCGTLNMSCQMFEGQAADEVNSQLASEVPLLSLLPCSCAAATSGLGVEKIAELVKETKQCGATLAQVGEALGDAANGVYKVGGDALEFGEDAASYALKLGEGIAKSVGSVTCAVSKLWGGCKSTPPSYKSTATAICKSHQSTWWAASKTEQPNDVYVQCNDGLYCWAWPGKDLACEQRRTKAEQDADIAQMKQWCPQHSDELKAGYQQQCHDGWCKTAVTNVANVYTGACLKLPANTEKENLPTAVKGAEMKRWTDIEEPTYISKFENLIRESIRRDPNVTAQALMSTYDDCKPFLGRADEWLCKWNGGYQACKKLVNGGKMKKCYLEKTGDTPNGGEYPLPSAKIQIKNPGSIQGANPPVMPGEIKTVPKTLPKLRLPEPVRKP